MALNISSTLVPQVINDYNAYSEDDLLIGLADEVTLPKIKNKTTTVSGMGIRPSPVSSRVWRQR